MHGDRNMVIPLLQLRQFDEYTTTHALTVSVLSMGLVVTCAADPTGSQERALSGAATSVATTQTTASNPRR